ncbi:MarR family winged helix-turn-helix transcriptional regulator [Sorangium sp. So ce1000]|uniref:MarR family winged helix-turn-helix transcriptional regulator n=1 Tax=Sorangium sp. So ce1000 TaxID=3133325 RepID=UPI003F630918
MADYTELAREIKDNCPGARIRQASRLFSRVYDEALRPLGIQASQLSVLVAVALFGENGATIGALAKALVMDRTTLTRNVKPLERVGLLRVARAPNDARARVIFLSRAGERMIESAFPLWELAQKRVGRVLGAERVDNLRTQLSDVIDFADELEPTGAAAP